MAADFSQAAHLALRLLAACPQPALPVDVEALIACQPGIRLLTYRQAAGLLDTSPEALGWELPSPDAFTFRVRHEGAEAFIICYHEKAPLTRRRFSLAHELGHVLLAQPGAGLAQESAVNCFAQHLLCPRAVVEHMAQAADPLPLFWVCRVFGLSPAGAEHLFNKPYLCRIDPVLEAKAARRLTAVLPPCAEAPSGPWISPARYLTAL